jgi:ABC-2 type transport system permease protein
MSALDVLPHACRVPSFAVRVRDVLLSEWTKVRSVRSTYWILLITAVTAIGGSVIVATATASSGHSPMDPLASIYLAWLEYPVLAVGILGVLAFTSEYATGQIRTTFSAVPQRRTVLAAKAGAVGLLTLWFSELLAFITFFLSEAILSRHHRGLSLTHAGVVGAVLGAGFSLFAIAIVGVGLGAIVRHTAGAIAALPAVIYLPLLLLSLPAPWADKFSRFTLLIASSQIVSLHPKVGLLSPTFSVLVVVAWPTASLLIAALLITRRDA